MLRIIPDFLGVVGFGTLIADVDAKMVRVDVIHLRGKYTVRSRADFFVYPYLLGHAWSKPKMMSSHLDIKLRRWLASSSKFSATNPS